MAGNGIGFICRRELPPDLAETTSPQSPPGPEKPAEFEASPPHALRIPPVFAFPGGWLFGIHAQTDLTPCPGVVESFAHGMED